MVMLLWRLLLTPTLPLKDSAEPEPVGVSDGDVIALDESSNDSDYLPHTFIPGIVVVPKSPLNPADLDDDDDAPEAPIIAKIPLQLPRTTW